MTKKTKKTIIETLKISSKDVGSSEVQIAILTHRIRELTDHVKVHKKHNHTRRGLVQLVSRRKKLLKYLTKKHADSYVKIVKELGIRG